MEKTAEDDRCCLSSTYRWVYTQDCGVCNKAESEREVSQERHRDDRDPLGVKKWKNRNPV